MGTLAHVPMTVDLKIVTDLVGKRVEYVIPAQGKPQNNGPILDILFSLVT